MTQLSHCDSHGRARMVDVSGKPSTPRQATVRARLEMSAEAFKALQQQSLAKGDPFTVAKIAGIQAAKRTDEIIPLCHSLPLEHLDIRFELDASTHAVSMTVEAITTAKTGIEMEAFVAAAVASLTLYDMIKAVDPSATITDLRLVQKSGGKHAFDRGNAVSSGLRALGSGHLPTAPSPEP